VFSGLAGGTYTVTASDNGYVNNVGAANPSQTVTVVPGIATPSLTPFQLDKAAVQATFVTSIDDAPLTPVNWDTFTVANSNETQTFGTVGTYGATGYSGALYPASYSAYAGTCTTDDPGGSTGTTGLTGATYTDPTVNPASGTTGSVQLIVPTMLLQPTLSYSATTTNPYDDTSTNAAYAGTWSALTNVTGDYNHTEHDSTWTGFGTQPTATFTFTGTGVELLVPEENQWGEASVQVTGQTGTTTIDEQSTTTKYQQNIWSDLNSLPYGTYTLVVKNLHQNDSQSNGYTIGIDEFIVSIPVVTTAPVTTWPSTWTPYAYDSCAAPVYRQASAPTATTVGSATVFPVQAPYGSSVQVCFANTSTGTNTGYLPSSTGQIANTNLNGTTITPLTLTTTSGATGASAVFSTSGACPT
jgi:hypothetical protein